MLGARAECEESGTERPDVAKRPKRGVSGLLGLLGTYLLLRKSRNVNGTFERNQTSTMMPHKQWQLDANRSKHYRRYWIDLALGFLVRRLGLVRS